MLATELSALHLLSHLILVTTLWGVCCYFGIADKEVGTEKLCLSEHLTYNQLAQSLEFIIIILPDFLALLLSRL